MKSFKEYLTESKKIYEFKVKIAGSVPKDATTLIKSALSQFEVSSVSTGRTSPIQERQVDFPEHKNVSLTIFDVKTSYPATSAQVGSLVASGLKLLPADVKAFTLAEEAEHDINHQHDNATGKAVVGTDYEASNHQNLVGEEQKLSFLKSLASEKKTLEQYTGVNDEILAKGQPAHSSETPGKQVEVKTKFINLFDKTTKVDPLKGVK